MKIILTYRIDYEPMTRKMDFAKAKEVLRKIFPEHPDLDEDGTQNMLGCLQEDGVYDDGFFTLVDANPLEWDEDDDEMIN